MPRILRAHCRGGLGRAGTIAARLLVEFGVAPEEAYDDEDYEVIDSVGARK